jgi:hypothetical protein
MPAPTEIFFRINHGINLLAGRLEHVGIGGHQVQGHRGERLAKVFFFFS